MFGRVSALLRAALSPWGVGGALCLLLGPRRGAKDERKGVGETKVPTEGWGRPGLSPVPGGAVSTQDSPRGSGENALSRAVCELRLFAQFGLGGGGGLLEGGGF